MTDYAPFNGCGTLIATNLVKPAEGSQGPVGSTHKDDRGDEMDVIDERGLIYVAVLFICSALAVFAGPARAAATFGVVAASIEGAYWVGSSLLGQYHPQGEGRGQPEARG